MIMSDFWQLKVVSGAFRSQALLTLLFLSLPLAAGQLLADTSGTEATDFQYEAELTAGETSLRRAELPWDVLAGMQQSGQADLRVYNADNQAVPFSVRQRNAEVLTKSTASRPLSFFSGDNAQHLQQLLANQQGVSARQLSALSANNRHYLIIPTEVQANAVGLTALELDWKSLRQWLPKSLRVESSDDLLKWRVHSVERLPYVLNERGVVLENRSIRLQQAVRAKFVRLSGGQDFAALLPALQKVQGHYQDSRQQKSVLNWQTVALSSGDEPQRYRYDSPPALTLLQWRLALPEPGYMYTGKLYSRRQIVRSTKQQKQADWRYRQRFQQYHLQTAAGVVRSSPEAASQLAKQQWLLEFEQPLTGDTVPQLEIAWQPLDVYFIAQGKGPFRLAYGSNSVPAVPAMQLDEKLMGGAERVQIGDVVKLREPVSGSADEPFNWMALLLWGVLGLSVVFLLWMAKRLWREMSGKQDAGAEK